MKVAPEIQSLTPYQPGKPIAETKREFGLNRVYKLASNENPLGASPQVRVALQSALSELHLYPDGACYEMRKALSAYYDVPEDWLVFGNGSDELVDRLVQIYCEPEDDAILTSQGAFIAYEISAQSERVRTIHTPLTADYRFDLQAMLRILEQDAKVRLVFLPNPNNPTGTYFTREEFEAFMAAAGKRDILVVLDEAYLEYVRASDYPQGREFQKRFGNLLLLRTMSKAFGLAALRVGILIAPPAVCDLVNRVRKPFNVNALAQVAAVAAVQDSSHIERVKQLTWEGLDYFYSELSKMGLRFCRSQGNFVFFDCGRDAAEIFTACLREGVILRPVKNYGFPTYLRMSVGLPEENRVAITVLKKVLGI
ncbi:MAG: histidinol-phosphate transaminase [Bdellovibrionales bacterium]